MARSPHCAPSAGILTFHSFFFLSCVFVPFLLPLGCGEVEGIDPVAHPLPDGATAPVDAPRAPDAGHAADVTPPRDDDASVDSFSPDAQSQGDSTTPPDAAPPPPPPPPPDAGPDGEASCDDHDACTVDRIWPAGGCLHVPITCSALDACHVAGVCNPTTGCTNPPAPDGTPCNDGLACTPTDTCAAGVCNGNSGGPAPRQLRPLSTSIVTSRRPALKWLPVAGATRYSVELCAEPTCSAPFSTLDAGALTSVTPAALLPEGRVFWRVRAEDGCRGTSPTWELVVGQGNTLIDTTILGPPDFNRDGRSDVAIGTAWGGSYVYLGTGSGLSAGPAQRLLGGRGMGYAGDVNGDGFGDLVTGTPYASGPNNPDVAYLHVGGAGGLTVSTTLVGIPTFGASIAGLGDVNGDGWGDVAIGGDYTARVSTLYFGGPGGLDGTLRPVTLAGAPVAGANDVNGDGYADVIVGAGSIEAVLLYHGGPSGVSFGRQLDKPHAVSTTGFGAAVAGVGDVNGDGFADVAVTDQSDRAYIFYGSSGGVGDAPFTRIFGAPSGGAFGSGQQIGHAGDVNDDGYSDVILGGYGNQVKVHHGGPAGLALSPATTVVFTAGEYAPSVATLGDTNGDGYADVMVAPGMCAGFPVLAYRGSATGVDATVPLASYLSPDDQCFGASLSR